MSDTKTSLSKRVISGGFWALSGKALARGLSLLKIILVARILSPDDLGLFGICMLALGAIEKFSLTGFEQAIIQKKNNVDAYLDTAWTVQVFRAGLIGVVLYFASPLIANFFKEPAVTGMIRTLGIIIVLSGFNNIGIVLLNKEIQFRQLFRLDFWATFVDFCISVALTVYLQNAWALVFGFLGRNLVMLFLSYILHPKRPVFEFNRGKFGELLRFGQWIWGVSILMFLLTQGDDALLGRVLGAAALAFYQMAYKISNMPTTEITHSLAAVIFPAYSILQEDLEKLRSAVKKTLNLTSLASFLISALIFSLANLFTGLVFTHEWMAIVPAVKVLCLFSIVRTVNTIIANIFNARGRPKVCTRGSFVQFLIFAAIVYPLTKQYGITGTAMSTVLPNLFYMVYISFMLRREIGLRVASLWVELVPALLGAVGCWLIILFGADLLPESFVGLFGLALLGGTAYILVVMLYDAVTGGSIRANLSRITEMRKR